METQGTIDGAAATIAYDPDGKEQPALKWKRDQQSDWNTIPLSTVLAVDRGSAGSLNILVAAPNQAGDKGPQISPVVFKTIQASNLPQSFISEFEIEHTLSQWRQSKQRRGHSTVHVIISTGSGTGQAAAVFEQLVQPLFTHLGLRPNEDYEIHTTASSQTITDLTKSTFLPRAEAGEAQLVILLSGDGGILDIVNSILAVSSSGQRRSSSFIRPTIALLPLGTGNALANSSNPPSHSSEDGTLGLRALLRGKPRTVPLFRATFSPGARLIINEGRETAELESKGSHPSLDGDDEKREGFPIAYGAVVGSWGLHAALVADSDTAAYRRFGDERFSMAAKEALFPSDGSRAHGYCGKVSVLRAGVEGWMEIGDDASQKEEDGRAKRKHGYVLVTLVRYLQKGFPISPSSQPLDGRLMLVRFGSLSGEEAMHIMEDVFDGGKHVDDQRVLYEEIDGLRIEMMEEDERWRRVCIDGKSVRVEKRGWVEIRGGIEGVIDLMSLET